MATTKVSAEPGRPFIDVEREFDAPRELVFRCHMEPELLKQWLGPGRLEMIVERWEPRDGSAWRYVNREADGTEYGFHGVFHGDPSPEGMVQTFEFEGAPGHVSLDTVTFEERGGRTILRIHSVHQTVEARDAMIAAGMESGVVEGYDRLDEVLQGLAAA
ncbi:MAG TPA: SRPBCC family protein [Candidatus Limnocylindrales bacterium]|jgi:uncharacterized protein YndB with AHSA1/START domain|nr:SRPBCC family protein [Candidatus Limnocylindrales bacterium]